MKIRKRVKRPPPRIQPPQGIDALTATETELELIQREAKSARRARVLAARDDVNEFAIFIGARLNKGRPWVQEPLHEGFQNLADDHEFLLLMSHPESGKTTQLTIIRTVWELGNNPDLRFALVSFKADSKGTGAKIALAIKTLIEGSPEVAEVFPDLVPGGKWEESIFTVRRPTFSKDPSVQVVGYKGTITGSRIDRVIIDDLLVLANTSNPDERAKFRKWLAGSVLERMSDGARAIFLCNAWHPKDYAHEEEAAGRNGQSVWHVAKVPVKKDDVFSCSFWNEERLEKERLKMTPLELARAFFCRARDDGESPFDGDAIKRAFDEFGADFEFIPSLDMGELNGAPVCCGIDLAVTMKKKSHRSAFMVGVKWPEDGNRQLIWSMSGRLRAEQIADYVLELDQRYHPIFIVENNAAQRWIVNVIKLKIERDHYRAIAAGLTPTPIEMPVIVEFTTGRNKAHPEFGIESLAAEIANDLWTFPDTGPTACIETLKRLREAMEFYTRGAHTPDELMALWFLREGLRRGLSAGMHQGAAADFDRGSQVRIVGEDMAADIAEAAEEKSLGEQLFI